MAFFAKISSSRNMLNFFERLLYSFYKMIFIIGASLKITTSKKFLRPEKLLTIKFHVKKSLANSHDYAKKLGNFQCARRVTFYGLCEHHVSPWDRKIKNSYLRWNYYLSSNFHANQIKLIRNVHFHFKTFEKRNIWISFCSMNFPLDCIFITHNYIIYNLIIIFKWQTFFLNILW